MNGGRLTGCSTRRTVALAVAPASLAVAGCASGGPAPASPVSEAEWRALASPRPAPLAGAARLSVTGVEILGQPAWPVAPVDAGIALSELVAAGLIRRADVRFVERRRFAAAVAAEESGVPRASGAPPLGVSEGAEMLASAVWIRLPAGGANVEVRLTEAARGAVVGTHRTALPSDADLVSTARATVGSIMAVLDELGRRPAWPDPVANAAPTEYVRSGVPTQALASFLSGLAAEESWRWEPARASYQAARESVGFFEADAALARAARLRLGGTLGES